MRARAIVVIAILAFLALVGGAAIYAAFSGGFDTVFVVMGIGVTGIVAGAAAIPLAMLIPRPALRPGAMAALSFIGVEAILIGLTLLAPGFRNEAYGITALMIAPTGVLVVASFFLITSAANRVAALFGLAAAIVSLALDFTFLRNLFGRIGWGPPEGEELLVLGLTLTCAALLVLAAAWRRPTEWIHRGYLFALVPMMAFVLTAAYVGILHLELWWVGVLRPLEGFVALAWALAATLSLSRLQRIPNLGSLQHWMRFAFVALGVLGSALLGTGVAFAGVAGHEAILTLGAALLVVAMCTLLASGPIWWFNRRIDLAERLASIEPGAIRCPRCRETIEIRPGPGSCAACGLSYKFILEAPHCRACRHDLSHVMSDVCPECGEPLRPVAEAVATSSS